MASPRPLEQSLLAGADDLLASMVFNSKDVASARLEILEGASSVLGGWDLRKFRDRRLDDYSIEADVAIQCGTRVLEAISLTAVPRALALSSLARPDMEHAERRRAGVYYTDFRLAQHVASSLVHPLKKRDLIIDPASGTGILLVAAGIVTAGKSRQKASHFIESQVCAADLDVSALRGTRLALASLTDSLDAIDAMDNRLRTHDSLLVGQSAWIDVAPSGFNAVIGNPPWEKLKTSNHEFLRAAGHERHYGDDTDHDAVVNLGVDLARNEMSDYNDAISLRFGCQNPGEPDLYKAFISLSLEIVRPGGQLALLVPAGLIRSSGTRNLRRLLLDYSSDLRLTVLDNRARFFAIDTRFKFLVIHAASSSDGNNKSVKLSHASGSESGITAGSPVAMGRKVLARVRPDLTIPEVRTKLEWRLFLKMSASGPAMGSAESPWSLSFIREVDMTNDRRHFTRSYRSDALPVIEGRMIHQFRTGAKAYRSGTGRRADWEVLVPGDSKIEPQFWISKNALRANAYERSQVARVGFCDITGQTNERSMLASLIPEGAVCGNKVPTVTFGGSLKAQEDSAYLWLAIVNSLPFDWLLRRTITTTVNYFLLFSMPIPSELTIGSMEGRRLIKLARRLMSADTTGPSYSGQVVATTRAEIDARVAAAYGLNVRDFREILNDFPLLDRGQPPLVGEARSTVTADLVLSHTGLLVEPQQITYLDRFNASSRLGAVAYTPLEYSKASDAEENRRIVTGA